MAATSSELLVESRPRPSPPRGDSPRARGRRAALGWLAIVFVMAVVLELACRIEDWVMYRMPLLSRYSSLDQLVVRDAAGMHGRPNAQYEKWVMNSLGMRGPSVAVAPSEGTHRIITVGASETFGLYESPGREYPRQLQDSLNAMLARGECSAPPGTRFEVLNGAFAGMGLPTIAQDVRNRLAPLRPEFIVVYPSPASYLDDVAPHAAAPDSSYRAVEPPLRRAFYPRALGRVREQLKQVLPEFVKARLRVWQARRAIAGYPPGWRFETVPTDRLEQYDSDLRAVIGSVRGIGARPILATHGNEFMGRASIDRNMFMSWEKFYPRATSHTLVAMDSAARDITRRVGVDSSVVVVDAASMLSAAPVSAFADFVHFTDFGAAIMAGSLSGGVLSAARAAHVCATDPATSPNSAEPR
jgi:hypothetical protein